MKRAVLSGFPVTLERDFGSVKDELRQSASVLTISDDSSAKPKK